MWMQGVEFKQTKWLEKTGNTSPERSLLLDWKIELWQFDSKLQGWKKKIT